MANHLDRDVGSPVTFIVSVGAIQILGILAMILTGVWMGKYLGGFAWDGSGLEFNYHPLCMVISMVFLYSEGKILTMKKKLKLKINFFRCAHKWYTELFVSSS